MNRLAANAAVATLVSTGLLLSTYFPATHPSRECRPVQIVDGPAPRPDLCMRLRDSTVLTPADDAIVMVPRGFDRTLIDIIDARQHIVCTRQLVLLADELTKIDLRKGN